MKQLILALALLGALTGSLLLLGRAVDGLTGPMTDDLTRAAAAAREEDWETAQTLLGRAAETWEAADGWLRLSESHQTVSDVAALLDEALVYAGAREPAPCRAAVGRTVRALTALRAAEQVSLGTVF